MVWRDARVSSFIMHTHMCVFVFCFLYFNSNSFCPVFATHAVFKWVFESIVSFAIWACERVCDSVFRFRSMLHFSNVWLYFIRICVVFLRRLEMKQRNRGEKEEYHKKHKPIWAAWTQKVRVMELQKTKLLAKKMRTAKMNNMQAAIPFIPLLACVILI